MNTRQNSTKLATTPDDVHALPRITLTSFACVPDMLGWSTHCSFGASVCLNVSLRDTVRAKTQKLLIRNSWNFSRICAIHPSIHLRRLLSHSELGVVCDTLAHSTRFFIIRWSSSTVSQHESRSSSWRMWCGWIVLWASFQLYPPTRLDVLPADPHTGSAIMNRKSL